MTEASVSTTAHARAIAHAHAILAAHAENRQITSLSGRDPALDLPAAYRVAAEVRRLREARGERVVGRKVGFTNTGMWDAYGVRAPIWGSVYDTTRHDLAACARPLPLSPFVEPRIEPEIVFGLGRVPEPGMDARALIDCVTWVAQGFEIVQSLFPGWRFSAPDTVAAFGLHGALVLGERAAIGPGTAGAWIAALRDFSIDLYRDDAVADRGHARNILGDGPLAALAHLVAMLADDAHGSPLAAGEVVSTGTLTQALPIAPGQRWRTRLSGLNLPDLDLAFA